MHIAGLVDIDDCDLMTISLSDIIIVLAFCIYLCFMSVYLALYFVYLPSW